jgi:c-di-GMP-related signal transduction protein
LIRDGEIDKDYLRTHRFHDTFLHFSLDNFELAQIFENQFLDEIIAYNELVDGSLELLKYLESKNYQLHIISNGFHEVTHRKIDGSLIEKINSLKDLEIIVNTIANFSKEFKVKTVAEYVSNEEIYNKIKELNIDYCQGYYFDKPLCYDAIE